MTIASAHPAATIMVLRDGPGGPELLMLRRSQKASFFPHAWVFPGGRVEPEDATLPTEGSLSGRPPDEHPFAVAAIRECFEESGVWLGQGQPGPALRAALNARTATLHDAPHLIADLARVRLWSWWITPLTEPRRYDTRFFVTALRPDELAHSDAAAHDEVETVESAWLTPQQILQGPYFLAPPTFLTLQEILPCTTAAEVLAQASHRDIHPITPVHGRDAQGRMVIALPGDPLHPQPERRTLTARLTLVEGRWQMEPPP